MSELPLEKQREAPEIRTVRIREIVRDDRFQIRRKLDQGAVGRYAMAYSNGKDLPAIKVAKVHNAFILVDGWHRVAALEKLGMYEVEAEIVEATEREALWMAAEANLEHGLPLKSPEVRKAFRAYVKARKHYASKSKRKTYRDIAFDIGGHVHFGTVRRWMQKDFPKIAAEMGHEELPAGEGGPRPPGCELEEIAVGHLDQFLAACKGVADPEVRGKFVHMTEQALQAMQKKGYDQYEEDF